MASGTLGKAASKLGKAIGHSDWLSAIGVGKEEIVLYLVRKDREARKVLASLVENGHYEGFPVRVVVSGKFRM